MTTADINACIRRCRAQAVAAATKMNLEAADDIGEMPIILSNNKRVTTCCGHYQHVASNGLGQITVYRKMCPDLAYLEAVLLHEFAHALVHFLRNGDPDPSGSHGRTFAYVMLTMGREPSKYVKGASDQAPETVYAKEEK